MAGFLHLEQIDKWFGEHHVLRDVSLAVDEGAILALLGPSGSGKTTLLRLLAGFEEVDRGRIHLGSRDVTHQPPARRRLGMVFQHYALFPHLDVGSNVAFGLESEGRGGAEVKRRVAEVLELVDLGGFAPRRVSQLSGGQQQRVALARALAPEPRLLLLDEPLSNLDPALRERTRRQLKQAIQRVGITTVFVTHEQEEAFDLGDLVAVLHAGRLEQVGAPEELYRAPRSRFVAGFVGRASRLRATVAGVGLARLEARDAGGGAPLWHADPAAELAPGEAAELVVRPEALALVPAPTPGAVAGRVVERRYAGAVTYYSLEVAPGVEVEVAAEAAAVRVGDLAAAAPSGRGPRPRLFPRREDGE